MALAFVWHRIKWDTVSVPLGFKPMNTFLSKTCSQNLPACHCLMPEFCSILSKMDSLSPMFFTFHLCYVWTELPVSKKKKQLLKEIMSPRNKHSSAQNVFKPYNLACLCLFIYYLGAYKCFHLSNTLFY